MISPMFELFLQLIILVLLGIMIYKIHQMRRTMQNIRMRFSQLGDELRKVDHDLKQITDRTRNL